MFALFYALLFRSELSNDARKVNQELQDLEKGQSVMVSMADHVLDTKKRVEYGVHQILLEVGELVRNHGSNINTTLNSRFDGMSSSILDHQNVVLLNLTTKMEQEMSQVSFAMTLCISLSKLTSRQKSIAYQLYYVHYTQKLTLRCSVFTIFDSGLETNKRHVSANDGKRKSSGQAPRAKRGVRRWDNVDHGRNGK